MNPKRPYCYGKGLVVSNLMYHYHEQYVWMQLLSLLRAWLYAPSSVLYFMLSPQAASVGLFTYETTLQCIVIMNWSIDVWIINTQIATPFRQTF